MTHHAPPHDWLADIKAGFIVSLIALPLCLGIAAASGFPPFAGLITAIIGGAGISWFGSAAFTIKGPAAGLIVIVLGAVMELGQGDMLLGYHQTLAVGVVAGVVQLALAFMRAAGLGIAMSKTVVHGMLAAIGIIILSKQVHVMMGVIPSGTGSFALLAEIPHSFMNINGAVSLIGFISLLILVFWKQQPFAALRTIPAPLIVLMMGVALAWCMGLSKAEVTEFMGMQVQGNPRYMVQLPDSFIAGISFPDFSQILTLTSLKYIIMFALVGAIESTLTVVAVDAIKEYKHPSNLNRDLLALSLGNIIASCLGGLPMISEIVRSKANIDAGATSYRANVAHGVFLLLYAAILSPVIALIPLAALAAMLVMVGLRLASLQQIGTMYHAGKDQLLLFVITIIVTLTTDLLMGVMAGLFVKILIHALRGVSPLNLLQAHAHIVKEGAGWRIIVKHNAAFPCLLKVKRALRNIARDETTPPKTPVIIDLSQAKLVDYTFLCGLDVIFAQHPNIIKTISGLDTMQPKGHHPNSTRVRYTQTALVL
jgi:MFS superfamily sulfate permease-like transporter